MDAFPEAGLGVSVAMDNVVYETDVLAASNVGPYLHRLNRAATSSPSTRRKRSENNPSMMSVWGQRPVLVLVGVRLGFDAVNPKYYEYVKVQRPLATHYPLSSCLVARLFLRYHNPSA